MSDNPGQSIHEAIARKKARLAEQAAAIEREMAELADLERLAGLAAKHNLVVSAAPAPAKDGDSIGTVADLAQRYRTDPRSPYHKVRYTVRQGYDFSIKRIIEDAGSVQISELDAAKVQSLYDRWAANGKLAIGRSLIGKLSLLSGFGVTVLNDDACIRLSTILHKMRFPHPESRVEHLTAVHAKAIRAKAHEIDRPSIALAQAFQFDLPLKQTDVIGEWVPLSEPGVSDIICDTKGKWIRGIRWEEIDTNLVLRHVTSMRQKEVEIDLKRAPMVMEELNRLGKLPARGPVIVSESDGKPWSPTDFRRWWRRIANAVGVPKNVKNRDSGRAVGSNENRSREAPAVL
jgi:hypothetical protein